MRGRSYSPSPPRYHRSSRRRSPSPRGHVRDGPTSLLVRNLRRDCRPDDLRRPFGEFGPLKDIYLPRDYYTGEPRGFGFVQYIHPADAEEAKYYMDGQILLGRELTVVFAEENRKRPQEMKARERIRGRSYDRKRSPLRYGKSYSRSPDYYSLSPRRGEYSRGRSYDRKRSPPRYRRSYSRSPEYYSPSPRRREFSRSISPRGRSYRERSYSRTPSISRSRSRSRSWSPEDY